MRMCRTLSLVSGLGSRTIELTPISMKGGRRGTWNDGYWLSVSPYEDTGERCRIGSDGIAYQYTNILFDQEKLALLRTRNISSVKLILTGVAGSFPSSTTTNFQIGYKLNDLTGIETTGRSDAWARGNADSTATAYSVAGYVRTTGEAVAAAGVDLEINLDTTIPVYGYSIGPASESVHSGCEVASTAKLVVEIA